MHEAPLFDNIVALVEQWRRKHTLPCVNRIRLQVGARGCVEPDPPRFWLDAVARGTRASRLAGQPDFTRRVDNRPAPTASDSLCWPFDVAACGSPLAIADSGNNRVVLWEAAP
jgi:hypothetical protein